MTHVQLALGDALGLTKIGVNLTTLMPAPGQKPSSTILPRALPLSISAWARRRLAALITP